MSEVRIARQPRRGMLMLRGDLSSKALQGVCTDVTGASFSQKLKAEVAGESGIAWMSPDEVLIMVPHAQVHDAIERINNALQETHFMLENVSDARAVFEVKGRHVREVMAKNCPVDLHPESFAPGDFRRTRFGQVAAAFWMRDEGAIEVICFASVADYVEELLGLSARMGSVGHF